MLTVLWRGKATPQDHQNQTVVVRTTNTTPQGDPGGRLGCGSDGPGGVLLPDTHFRGPSLKPEIHFWVLLISIGN